MNLYTKLQDKARRDEGFTLVELLVVIVILGVLSAVVVFSVSGITNRGQSAACRSDAKAIEVGIEAHRAAIGSWPASLATLAPGYVKTLPNAEVLQADGTFVMNSSTGHALTYNPTNGALANACPA